MGCTAKLRLLQCPRKPPLVANVTPLPDQTADSKAWYALLELSQTAAQVGVRLRHHDGVRRGGFSVIGPQGRTDTGSPPSSSTESENCRCSPTPTCRRQLPLSWPTATEAHQSIPTAPNHLGQIRWCRVGLALPKEFSSGSQRLTEAFSF
jgi:hypothetical protein